MDSQIFLLQLCPSNSGYCGRHTIISSYLSRCDTAVLAETVSAERVPKVTTAQTGVDVLVPTEHQSSVLQRVQWPRVLQGAARSQFEESKVSENVTNVHHQGCKKEESTVRETREHHKNCNTLWTVVSPRAASANHQRVRRAGQQRNWQPHRLQPN